ncbi:putative ATPase [Isoptericola sp. CG 20/1183]|uniref:ATPase n=1 Tax=Isoptericola halotolerans TaxID=300560 RepID=A0ABX5EAG0_9MICO|nr:MULTISPECIES: DUF3696 domain-containing protein [Isoptericola]PRZ03862.1 putative ATPase [Isoptericola sp. CG 20/1183]PRZ04005.1 putative ATPase [Isoptericola halotolerans]
MINAIELTNFKAFSHSKIALKPLTLLTGLNSSGKSTVLQAFGLLQQALDRLPENFSPGRYSDRVPLNGEYVELGTGRDVLHEGHTSKPPTIEILTHFQGGKRAGILAEYVAASDALPFTLIGASNDGVESLDFTVPDHVFQYLRADRVNPSTTYPRSYRAATEQHFLGTRGEYTGDYLREHQDDLILHGPRLHPHGQSNRLLAQVDAWLGEICPGVQISAEAIDNTDLVRLGFRNSSPGAAVSLARRPTNVGFGLAYSLPIIVSLLAARSGALLLLENPEAHLHPRGQSAMARLACAAAATGTQVLIETHSDHVLNGVRLAVKNRHLAASSTQLHYFQPGDGGAISITSPEIGEDGMISAWPEGFFDEWDYSIESLLE